MPELTLGLDLGPSSIGWALLDEVSKRIVVAGVRVFPEGVDRDQQGGEKSKTQTRREARGARRQIARRAARKKHLRHLLTSKGLLPEHDRDLQDLLASDPYDLRRRALDERLMPHEVGRVLLHLGQRRGFLSNRKTDRQKAGEAKGMLAEISELAGAISDAGHRTLGEYLAELHSDPHQRIRNRHTQRSMYVEEFEAVWSAQQAHHPKILTDALKKELYDSSSDDTWIHKGLIFGQRRMYWPKSMVGRCEYELEEKRCPKADRHAQQFRILQEVNNLRLLDRSTGEERELTPGERGLLVEYLSNARQRTFDQIRKKLGFTESTHFNLERKERDKLKGGETDALLGGKNGVGSRWKKLPDEAKDAIVDVLIDEDQEHVALERLTHDHGLEPEEAVRALKVHLPQGHMNVSRMAIDKLIPFLKKGMFLMADDETNSAVHAAGYLRPDERAVGQREFLPGAPDLPNPIVRQALVEVRKVVNAVIREFGKPARIHIELARDAKKSFEQRQEIRFEMARRRKEREGVRQELEEYDPSIKPTLNTLRKYQLWREQGETCVYCGRKISQAQLFDGSTDVDHILPRWRSLDNSMANKVVCHHACNADKGDRTPREWLEDADPQRYAEVLRVAELLPYNKRRKFQLKEIVLDEFVARQLRDTAYISRCVT
ncbi:MAG: type II CRISPR RNA-guided endonuclease Cas9, partial [Planctomycetes bacterium]|nr:type II CRISPR RNA-guided endonuclease Cas9 [Planctomycetota bacterium]